MREILLFMVEGLLKCSNFDFYRCFFINKGSFCFLYLFNKVFNFFQVLDVCFDEGQGFRDLKQRGRDPGTLNFVYRDKVF